MPTTPRPYHHGDLKNALVAAGLDLLDEGGLPGLTLRAIAARVGVSHTAPKNHFGSLRGLTTAIAAEGFRRHAAFMRDGLPEGAGRRERLIAAGEGYVRFALTYPALFEIMFSPLHCEIEDPERQEASRASYAVLEEVSRGLDWGDPDGQTGGYRAELRMWSLVHGYAKLLLEGQIRCDAEGTPLISVRDLLPPIRFRDADQPLGL